MYKPPHTRLPSKVGGTQIAFAIRNDNPTLSAAIPKISEIEGDPLAVYWNAIKDDSNLWNMFAHDLVNRISRTIVSSMLFENPLSFTKKGLVEYGDIVQDIFIKLVEPMEYAPAEGEKRELKRYLPDISAVYYSMNYTKMYPVSVSYNDLKLAFTSDSGVTSLIERVIQQIYSSANIDEFLVTKYIMARAILAGFLFPITVPEVTADTARSFVTNIKTMSGKLTFPSTEYNPAGVYNYSDKSRQYLFYTPKIQALTDVEVLAQAFNMDRAEFAGHQVLIDSFAFSKSEITRLNKLMGETHDIDGNLVTNPDYVAITDEQNEKLSKVQAVQVDISFFMIFDNLELMTEQQVQSSLYTTYFYHVWKTFYTSPFAPAIVYTTDTNSITSVTVSPSEATISPTGSIQLTAEVDGTGIYSPAVTWSVPDGSVLTVDGNGLVRLGGSGLPETETDVIVTATSVDDTTKTGTATITVPAKG